MTQTIRREMLLPQPSAQVWQALTDSRALAEWMYPNDFEPRVGHAFTFRVPPKPEVGFDGMIVRCVVLECSPPSRLVFSWGVDRLSATQVSFRLEPDGERTRLSFEHAGFDLSQWGEPALRGAEYGWASMLKKLPAAVSGVAVDPA